MKKKLLLASILLAFGLASCGGQPAASSEPAPISSEPAPALSSEEPAASSEAPAEQSVEPESLEPESLEPGSEEEPVVSSEAPAEQSEEPESLEPESEEPESLDPESLEPESLEPESEEPISSEEPESEEPESEEPASSESHPGGKDEDFIDYAHDGSVQLNLDFEGHTFFADGVEKVTLYNTIDGDTAHFKSAAGEVIKCRFYGIDTPESTGKVQPYGFDASDFTSNLLKEADKNGTIVVSSAQDEYGAPKADSTGSRYVSLIWINTEKKNAPLDELYLVNLMVVQEGLSWVKGLSDMPQFAPTFLAAEQQAKDYKLKLHSGEIDPRMPVGEHEMVTLLELKQAYLEEIEEHKKGNTDFVNRFHNKKVRIQGTVNGYSNHTLYMADFCYYLDEDGAPIDDSDTVIGVNGEYASINVFTGMGSIDTKYTTLGTYIEVCGLALDSKFGFQITDTSFPTISRKDTDAKVILKAKENLDEHALHVFDFTASELNTAIADEDYNALNCRINMTTPVKCTKFYKSDDGDITLTFERPNSFKVYFTFKFKPYPDQKNITWTTEEQFVGQYFTCSGVFARHEAQSGNVTMQIYPSVTADLVLIQQEGSSSEA